MIVALCVESADCRACVTIWLSGTGNDVPDDRAGALLALPTVADACGGLDAVAMEAGISREFNKRKLAPWNLRFLKL